MLSSLAIFSEPSVLDSVLFKFLLFLVPNLLSFQHLRALCSLPVFYVFVSNQFPVFTFISFCLHQPFASLSSLFQSPKILCLRVQPFLIFFVHVFYFLHPFASCSVETLQWHYYIGSQSSCSSDLIIPLFTAFCQPISSKEGNTLFLSLLTADGAQCRYSENTV